MNSYKTIIQPGIGSITEKKSRFIGRIYPAGNESEVASILANLKSENKDANHNCYAFALGEIGQQVGFSDDGEPSGTAGKPILSVIQGAGLTNVVIVVTRFFGGTLLGTGGLVRAYTDAAKESIKNTTILTKIKGVQMAVWLDYSQLQNFQYAIKQMGLKIIDTIYEEKVKAVVELPCDSQEELIRTVETITKGQGQTEAIGDCWISS